MTDYTQSSGHQKTFNTTYSTWETMAPPQDTFNLDQAASSTSASQPPNGLTTSWGTNGTSVMSYNTLDASSMNHATQHSRPINGISVNTQNLPISTQPTVTQVIESESGKILCVADIRGNISRLNELALKTGAKAVIHTGDFGFYEISSLERIGDRALRHIVQYSNIIPNTPSRGSLEKVSAGELRRIVKSNSNMLSEFPLFLDGSRQLQVPVYTVWGACEDVRVLEKFRTGEYNIPNLYILDEVNSYTIDIGNVCLRLFGLGGACVLHKLFDCGEGETTIAGGLGTMWTTMLQIGELVNTATQAHDPTETRVLVTHASPGREGLLTQLAIALRVDFTISAGLHFRYGISYNEYSVHSDQSWRNKLENSKKAFDDLWEQVKAQVERELEPSQRELLDSALSIIRRVPSVNKNKEEPGFVKNMWNFNLPDAAYGHLLLNVDSGRVSSKMKAQGFNFAYRRNIAQMNGQRTSNSNAQPLSPNPSSPIVTRRAMYNSPSLGPQPTLARSPSPLPSYQRSISPRPMNQQSEQGDPKQHAFRNIDAGLGDVTQRSTQESPIVIQKSAAIGRSIIGSPAGNAVLNLGSTTNANSSGVRTIPIASSNTTAYAELDDGGSSSQDTNNDAEENRYPSRNILSINGNTNAQVPTWADQTTSEYSHEDQLNGYANGDKASDSSQNGHQNDDLETSSNMNDSQRDERSPQRRPLSKFCLHVKGIEQDVTKEQIQNFFGGEDAGIENIRFVPDRSGDSPRRDFVYIDFADEESLEAGLSRNQQVLGTTELKIDRAVLHRGAPRGRRGRGGRGRPFNQSYSRGRGNHRSVEN